MDRGPPSRRTVPATLSVWFGGDAFDADLVEIMLERADCVLAKDSGRKSERALTDAFAYSLATSLRQGVLAGAVTQGRHSLNHGAGSHTDTSENATCPPHSRADAELTESRARAAGRQ
jgi:hypothetical protein